MINLNPWIYSATLLISGSLIWFSGTHLALYSDWISHRYQLGRAFIGAFLLAIATSLPEVATTITASWIGNAPLAINNLLGGINLQTTIIAVADLFLVTGSLTFFSPRPSLLIGGVFVVIQLAVASVGMTYGEIFSIGGVGFWPFLLFVIYLLMLYFILHHENDKKWVAVDVKEKHLMKRHTPSKKNVSNNKLLFLFCIHALLILIAGWATAYSADKLTVQWNWSSSWMGATLVAFTTSLPEISTTFGAVRQKAYVLAIANIFGSNVLTIALLFVADFFYRKGPIINETTPSNFILTTIGIVLTCIFLWGILERKNKTIFRMGFDSFTVIIVYFVSLYFLYQMSQNPNSLNAEFISHIKKI